MSETAPTGLWLASFELPAVPALPVLEAIEELAASVSIFEIESDDDEKTTRWRVELLCENRPSERQLRRELDALLVDQSLKVGNLSTAFLQHDDWLAKAAMPREALELGRFYVHGEGEPVPAKPGRIALAIDAGMAFGSGEHGSTAGCLLAFHQLLRRHKFQTILDMGCGSAILAIAAAKALPNAGLRRGTVVMAADNDPLAVQVARQNCIKNEVGARIRCLTSEGYAHPQLRRHGPFELIFANILADPLCAMAPDLKRHLARGGYAILAGLLDNQADRVVAAHREVGLRLFRKIDMSPWQTLVLKRPGQTS